MIDSINAMYNTINTSIKKVLVVRFSHALFIRPVRKTLVLNTICTVCITQAVYYIRLLCVKYSMYAYAGPAYICRMYAPSMLFPPTQSDDEPRDG